MQRIGPLISFLIVLGVGVSAYGQATASRFFRIRSTNDVVFTDMTTDGQLSWSNQVAGSTSRVETADGMVTANDWHTYTHVISTGNTTAVKLWDENTPDGFAFCPAGTFVMGSPTYELGRWDDETQHQVTLTRCFYMQKTEVTNRQMADVLNWALGQGRIKVTSSRVSTIEGDHQMLSLHSSHCQISWDGSHLVVDPGKDAYPCLGVAWLGGQVYCNYLSEMEGLDPAISLTDDSRRVNLDATGYRLPTEAEWEYACRAGTTTAFYTGGYGNRDRSYFYAAAWYLENSSNPENPLSNGNGSHPVGLKRANSWDLFDMHGNAFEWCADFYGDYPGTVTDPIGPATTFNRPVVLRGGDWLSRSHGCSSAARGFLDPFDSSRPFYGFRPVRTIVP